MDRYRLRGNEGDWSFFWESRRDKRSAAWGEERSQSRVYGSGSQHKPNRATLPLVPASDHLIGRSRRDPLRIKGRSLIFAGSGPCEGLQPPQNLLEGQPKRTQAIWDVSGVHFWQLPDRSDWQAANKRWSDESNTYKKGSRGQGCESLGQLGCRDLAMVEFRIPRGISRAKSRITNRTWREQTSLPWEMVLKTRGSRRAARY